MSVEYRGGRERERERERERGSAAVMAMSGSRHQFWKTTPCRLSLAHVYTCGGLMRC